MSARWLKPFTPLLDLAKGGFILAVAFFAFSTVQTWCDHGIKAETLRWLLPSAVAALVTVVLTLVFKLDAFEKYLSNQGDSSAPRPRTPPEMLAEAVVEYGIYLHGQARDQAVVSLRNNFTMTLHVLGFNESRRRLGEVALQSSGIVHDNAAKAEILIDDLGWANYLLGDEVSAIKNIHRGIDFARSGNNETSQSNALRFALAEAKGLRHLAIIKHQSTVDEADQHFNQAMEVLNRLDQSAVEVQRDRAQLFHARALAAATQLGIHKEGFIRKGDKEATESASRALDLVRKSAKIFHKLGDRDRYAKALSLEVRLLEAKHEHTEAVEVAGLRDRALGSSEWARPEGIDTITGVRHG